LSENQKVLIDFSAANASSGSSNAVSSDNERPRRIFRKAKGDWTRSPSARFDLRLLQEFTAPGASQRDELRCTIIDLDVGVALRDEAPKPQFLVGLNEGKVTTAGSETTLEGTWAFCGGTGKFAGITGQGTYRGRMPSASEVEMSWEGRYELAVSAQAA
jgi:hypothetical protein